ncbi:MAG: hypothetical protein H6686_09255 [Fibrobacteria bacterium]|nr:hypothetical protein [Fibrobacteria bacterium]
MKHPRLLIAAGLALGLAACDNASSSSPETTGSTDGSWAAARAGEDAVGVALAGTFDDSDLVPGSIESNLPPEASAWVAGRRAQDVETETLDGEWFVKTRIRGDWSKVDSIHIVPSDVLGRDTSDIRATSVVSVISGPMFHQRTEATDADGDGYVLGNASEEHLAHVTVVKSRGDFREISHLLADAGPDGNLFADADNRVRTLRWTRIHGTDTLRSLALTPVEGDTLVSGDDRSERTLIATLHKKTPLVVRDLVVRIRIHGTDTTVVGLRGTSKWWNGREEAVSVSALREDGNVLPGDTARLKVDLKTPAGDSLLSSSFTAVVEVGSQLGSSDSKILLIEGSREFRGGRLLRSEFRLACPEGCRDGQDPTSGTFRWSAQLRAGGTVLLEGTFTTTGVHATWTGPEGRTEVVVTKR